MRVQLTGTAIALTVLLGTLAPVRPACAIRDKDASRGSSEDAGTPLDRILAVQMDRMTKELKLSDDQVAAIAPRVRRMAEAQVEARRKHGDLMQRLQEDTDAGDEAKQREDLERIREHDERSEKRIEDLQKDISDQLTPNQQARYILFSDKFRRELKQIMGEVRSRREKGQSFDAPRPRRRDK